MAKSVFKDKIALVLGAENPVGRAIALQLSRVGSKVLLSGFDKGKLDLLSQLIAMKGGGPTVVPISSDKERSVGALRSARDGAGHLHFVVNTLSVMGETGHEHATSGKRAEESYKLVHELVAGRGTVRFLTVWLDAAGGVPKFAETHWHCIIRLIAVQTEADQEGTMDPQKVKAAGLADAVLSLLDCPGSACPVEVRVEARSLKG